MTPHVEPPTGTEPRIVSLCSGYGGLEIAVTAGLGGRTVAFAEKDPSAASVFTAHHPGVPNLGDITATDWHHVRGTLAPDVVAAGFPCQDISNAGRRVGIGGTRSGVWKNVAEAVRVLRPRLVFLENVAAIRSRGLDVVAGDLAALGYDARWTCLRAGDPAVGAPHQRDRWFAVAYPAAEDPHRSAWGQRRPAAPGQTQSRGPRADAGGRGGVPAAGGPVGVSLLPTPAARDWKSGASNLLGTNSRPLNEVVVNLLPTPKASDGPHGGPNQRDTAGRYYLPGLAVRLGGGQSGDVPALLPTPKASDGPFDSTGAHNSHGRYYLPGTTVRLDDRWVGHDGTDYGPAIRRWENVTGHPAPCPTEPGTRGNRRLSAAFAEWLMGLPPGHVTGRGLPRKEELKILGNGAVPQQAFHAYGLLLRAHTQPNESEEQAAA